MSSFKIWFRNVTFGETGKYIKLFLWNFLDSFVAAIPYAVMVIAIYLLLMPIADFSQKLPLNRLWILCGILLVQTVVYFFIRRNTYIKICVGFAHTTKKARISMGEHLKTLPMGFFNRRDAGDLSTVLLRDYTEAENLASGVIPQISVILVRLSISIIVLSAFSWTMALAVILTIPLSLPFAVISYKRIGKVSSKLLKTQQEASSRILEYVGGIQTLKAFNQAGEHFRILKETFLNQSEHSKGMEMAAAPIGIVGRFVLNCGVGLVMLCGVWLLRRGEISPFYYIVFLLLSLNIYEPIMTVFAFIADYARTNNSVWRIHNLKNEKPLPEAENSLSTWGTEITFKDVSFSYGNKEVLHKLSFSIPPKSFTALVGPSGSGKSTIIRLVARFWDVNEGEIIIGGVPLTKMKTEELFSKISMVFQDVYLFHDTIEANIRMGNPQAEREEIIEAAKRAACHQFISALPQGYDTLVGEGGSTLSGGEKQRISIARALLKNAPIVLLDEATASLDPENEILIQQAISALVKDKTVIVIAHRLQSIKNAQQIIVLHCGEIRERGNHDVLMKKGGMYARLWEEQSKSGNWRLVDSIVN